MSELKSEYELSHNGENYPDPTPYHAIKNIEREEAMTKTIQSDWELHHKLIGCILRICELAGFSVESRIVLRDKKTGRLWE